VPQRKKMKRKNTDVFLCEPLGEKKKEVREGTVRWTRKRMMCQTLWYLRGF
jgi:hypothetical protein